MVKESTRESAIKKKRKTPGVPDADGDSDVYKKAVEFEEKEALSRPNDVDAQIYFNTCKEIRTLFNEISELKQSDANNHGKIMEKTTQICLQIVLLKKLNRMEKVRLVFPKEQLAAEKQKVDSINLQYQNMLYEANHLIAEYRKCFQFKSKDETIDLVPVEEFLLEAPENLTKKFVKFDESDELVKHELRLARLEWELQQRINLADMCKKLEEEKKKLEADITERKNRLEKLGPLLNNVMIATKPVQEHLGLHIDKIQAEHKLASLLPNPLYLFYANISAYRQVIDSSMVVEIVGDQDDAQHWKDAQLNSSVAEDDDSEPDVEIQENEEVVETKKRRHRKSIQVDPKEEKKKKLLQVHPLSIEVTVSSKDGPSIVIKLSYYHKLELVTISSTVNIPSNITGNAARDVLSNESILVELQTPGDFGVQSPNPCTPYQLKKVGLGSFKSLVSELGFVYEWAQKICGVDFLTKQISDQLSQTNVELVMKTIKKRLKSRYILAQQLEELEKNVIPTIPNNSEFSRNTISTLTKWVCSTYQHFCQSKFTDALVEAEFAAPSDVFYLATISRATALLQAFIVIKNDYPSTPPIFSLCLNYNHELKHSQNDDNIRDMERSINLDINHDLTNLNWSLSCQIISLCVALDIYLETDNPRMFPQNTMYIKSSCARNRRKPFKFRNIGVGVFTQ